MNSSDMMINGGLWSVEEVIGKLKFIARINADEKIDVDTLTVQPVCHYTSLVRTLTLTGESKWKTLRFIRDTINQGWAIAEAFKSSQQDDYQQIRENIIQDLIHCKIGLSYLKKTYETNRHFVAQLDAIVQVLDARMSKEGKDLNPDRVPDVFRNDLKSPDLKISDLKISDLKTEEF